MQTGRMLTSIVPSIAVATGARLCMMLYGVWQDETMSVKYTDVDYNVFTDAARHVTEGDSPYDRATYRYTPLLAWLLIPNIYLSPVFGKLLFILFDVWAGYLIYIILQQKRISRKAAVISANLWLLNPLPMAVSSRGNAESIMAVLVLATIYCLQHESMLMLMAGFILHALSIHVKIYPLTYALPVYLMLSMEGSRSRWWRLFGSDVWPNRFRILYIVTTGVVLLSLMAVCYSWYGEKFVQETYLYHVTRRDTRHNFSVYFYMLYLTGESEESALLGLLTFLPQLLLLVVSSFRYYKDLPFCCFLHTFIFVTFNKVCTSQYFLWYLCLLPLIVPDLKLTLRRSVLLVLLWFTGQALWLTPAYYLEFEGQNVFFMVWLAGLVFFSINIAILYILVKAHTPVKHFWNTPTNSHALCRKPIHYKEA